MLSVLWCPPARRMRFAPRGTKGSPVARSKNSPAPSTTRTPMRWAVGVGTGVAVGVDSVVGSAVVVVGSAGDTVGPAVAGAPQAATIRHAATARAIRRGGWLIRCPPRLRSSGGRLGEDFLRQFEVRGHALDIVLVLERLDEAQVL